MRFVEGNNRPLTLLIAMGTTYVVSGWSMIFLKAFGAILKSVRGNSGIATNQSISSY